MIFQEKYKLLTVLTRTPHGDLELRSGLCWQRHFQIADMRAQYDRKRGEYLGCACLLLCVGVILRDAVRALREGKMNSNEHILAPIYS